MQRGILAEATQVVLCLVFEEMPEHDGSSPESSVLDLAIVAAEARWW